MVGVQSAANSVVVGILRVSSSNFAHCRTPKKRVDVNVWLPSVPSRYVYFRYWEGVTYLINQRVRVNKYRSLLCALVVVPESFCSVSDYFVVSKSSAIIVHKRELV